MEYIDTSRIHKRMRTYCIAHCSLYMVNSKIHKFHNEVPFRSNDLVNFDLLNENQTRIRLGLYLGGRNNGGILVTELGVLLDVPDEGDEGALVHLPVLEVVLLGDHALR